jgi:hypothetical protein
VFEGTSPSVNTILCELKDEHSLRCMADAKKMLGLGLTRLQSIRIVGLG